MQLVAGKATRRGDPVQVSRLGNPLVNEVVVPAGLKDAFNALTPTRTPRIPAVVERVHDPELPKLIEAIYGVPAPATPAQRPGRDLPDRDHRQGRRPDQGRPQLAAEQPDVDPAGSSPSEMLRLNTVDPARPAQPNRLGVLGGDLQGFPNGRRLADDVVDIALQAVEGAAQTGKLVDALAAGDKVDANDAAFASTFPYVALPGNVTAADRRWAARPSSPTRARPAAAAPDRAAQALRRLGRRDQPRSRCSRRPRAAPGSPTSALVAAPAAGRGGRRRSGDDAVPPPSRRGPGEPGRVRPRRLDGGPADHGLHRPPRHRAVPAGSRSLLVAALAVLLLVSVIAAGLDDRSRDTPAGTPQPVPTGSPPPSRRPQERLRRVPGDAGTWAALGSAYVEQARVSGNPAYYAQAQGAAGPVDRSCSPRATPPPLVGLGALANARHDFAAARGYAEQALASNPYEPEAYGVLADAATQLGDTAPPPRRCSGCSSCVRASPRSPGRPTTLELHGRVDEARVARNAPSRAVDQPHELAFCRYYLGELAWGGGDLEECARPVRARARRRAGRPDVAARTGPGARRRRPGRRGDHRVRPADAARAATAVPARVRRAAGVGRPVGRRPVRSTGSSVTQQRIYAAQRPARRRDRRAAGRRSRRPRRGGPAGPRPSGRAGRASTPRTCWPGRCTRPAGTPRPCRSPEQAARPGPAGRDGRLPPRDDPGPALGPARRARRRSAGRGPGHQPALLARCTARRPRGPWTTLRGAR